MSPRSVETDAAPAPVGPYSQAVEHDGMIFVSGQIPLDPNTGKLVAGGIREQTTQVLANLRAVLEAAGSGLEHAVRVGIYLTDLSQFPELNEVYAQHFTKQPLPARSTLGVAALPLGASVEIDAIAIIP